MRILLVAGILTFLVTCATGRQASISHNADTVLLYRKDTLLITGIVPSVLPFRLTTNTRPQYDSGLKTLLLLENPKVVTIPEGVYEVYITYQPPDIYNFSSSLTGFVTVLDLYSLTAPGSKRRLEVDISEPVKNYFLQKQPLLPAYISIRFGAIKLPDGSYSSKAGELRFTGIRIVQVKN